MLDLRSTLGDLPAAAEALRPGSEQAWGWGVFALPFDTGHVLALRVIP